ncbi:amidase domain-containing protein [Kitasatospora sp. RB6PN24]|uniref:amidase domain-containing protein n=1 Tax=Kitasatospora humi TaxID=2893891 RepID=UPI001E42B4FD|nr:amidase domain-containing protein [Kitasatospora humi]MCC9307972.1 amidase domain-containing protein [Kitasatospora humi]
MDIASLKQANSINLKAAADGWTALAKECWQAVNDIHDNGVNPVKQNWQDRVGRLAGPKLAQQADILEAGADIMRGVAMVLDGLTAEVIRAKTTLVNAFAMASSHGFTIDEAAGQVRSDAVSSAPDAADAVREINALLQEALREATQADQKAAAELRKLAGATCETSPNKALDSLQGEASQTELDMYNGGIPSGDDPKLVADWWNGLDIDQQQQLELSSPVALANLNGIPDDVKQNLRGGPGAKYDRVKVVQWALDHWNDDSSDMDSDNCTNFASEALHQGGVQYKGWNTLDDSGWFRGGTDDSGFGLDAILPQHTHAWGGAQNMHDFMMAHGGQEIPPDAVKPGDLVYYEEDSDQDTQDHKGAIHHTAVVTAVTPDGDIRYTQHSGDMKNGSINGRIDAFQEGRGHQKLHFVRVNPDWY